MKDMKPLPMAKVVSTDSMYFNHIVMRTAYRDGFEVMDLTDPQADACWADKNALRVELMPPGFQITLTVV